MTPIANPAGRVRRLPTVLIFGLQMFTAMAFWSYSPLVEFLRRDLQLSAAELAMVPLVLDGAGLALAPLAGWWVDRADPILVMAILLAMTVLGLVTAGSSPSFAMLLVGLAIVGMAFVAVGPLTNRMLSNTASPRRRGTAYSLKQSSVTVGMLLGGVLLPIFAHVAGWRVAFLVAAGISASFGVLALSGSRTSGRPHATPDTEPAGRSDGVDGGQRSVLRSSRRLLPLFWMGFVFQGVVFVYMTFTVPFVIDSGRLNLAEAGLLLGCIQVAAIASRPLLGWLSDVWPAPDRAAYLVALALVVGLLLVASGMRLPSVLLVGLVAAGGAFALAWIGVFFARLAELSHEGGLGFATGVALVPIKLGGMVIPLGIGLVIDEFSYRAGFTSTGALLLVSAIGWWWLLGFGSRSGGGAMQPGRTTDG